MRALLAPAHLALTFIILVWDIVLAGRLAQNNRAPRVFQTLSGLGALLILPALLFALATSTVILGRAVASMDWLWPAVLLLFAVQAVYALARRLVNPFWGLPIAVYNILIATIGVSRYVIAHGFLPSRPLVILVAAQSLAMVFAGGSAGVLMSPLYVNVPMVSPAFPASHQITATFRFFMSTTAIVWTSLIVALGLPRAVMHLRAYDAHSRDQLRERPAADFAIGLKILPDVSGPPTPASIRSDSALVDSLEVDAIAVIVTPGAGRAAIDSLARVLERAHGDSTVVIVGLGYGGGLLPGLRRAPFNKAERLATLRLMMSRLHPDIVLPAEDPYGSGERALGPVPLDRWKSYLTDAARVAKSIDRKVRVGVAASSYRTVDSALYAWAASPGSPIDVVGFSLFPSPYVGGGIQSDTRTADRWMHATPSTKEHWVFATGGYPLAYGERSQEEAIWEVLAWATDHPVIKGLVVYEAGDYGQARGLRAPNGHLRIATRAVTRAVAQIRESAR